MKKKLSALTTPKKMAGILAAALLIPAGWYWYSSAAQKQQQGSERPVPVSRATIEEVVTAQGKLEPKQYVDVGTQVSGQLKEIHVDIGDSVSKGQLLAEIDPRVYQAQVEAGEARLNSLRAQLNEQKAQAVLAEQNLRRNQNLIKLDAVSQQALQETESSLEGKGRVLLRASGTEPVIRVMVEGEGREAITQLAESLADTIRRQAAA